MVKVLWFISQAQLDVCRGAVGANNLCYVACAVADCPVPVLNNLRHHLGRKLNRLRLNRTRTIAVDFRGMQECARLNPTGGGLDQSYGVLEAVDQRPTHED